MSHRISRRAGATALLAMAGLLGTLLIAVPAAPAATINACQKKKGGTIRIVSSKTKCKKTEKKVRWSTTGASGKNGANGTNGTNGTNGAAGTNGAPGVAGQPQKGFAFDAQSDIGGILLNNYSTLFTVGDVSVRMACGNFIANIVGIEATAPAGSTSHTGMIVTRSNGSDAPQADPTAIQNDNVTTNTSIVVLITNTTGDLTNLGHVTGTITTPTQVVMFTMALKVGPSGADACTAKGSAIGIPR